MTNGELVERLVKEAKAFRADITNFARNDHMHEADPKTLKQVDIDAVLTCFLNHLAARMCCLDLAFYSSDFAEPETTEAPE